MLADVVARALTGIPLRTAGEDVEAFRSDESGLVGGTPLAVVSPRTVEDVQRTLRTATEHQLPVVPRGAGTGLSGGACAVPGGLVVDMSRMAAITTLDPASRLAVVEAGVVNADVSSAARRHGLMYAPDPSSWESSTIGGNVATNAGGLRCARYGATRGSVLGLRAVLADGRIVRTGGGTVKRSAGYDLTQLFVGSEGTLGIVVEATLRLLPLGPPQLTLLASFDDVAAAALTAQAVTTATTPTLLELMDELVIRALDASRGAGFGHGVGAVLVAQVDDTALTRTAVESAMSAGGAVDTHLTSDPFESKEILDIRRGAFGALQTLGPLLVEDVCVPLSRLAQMVSAVAAIGSEHGVRTATVAHAADGNLHPVVLREGNTTRENAAAEAIFQAAQAIGGTVSGEHGIGRLKREWLRHELDPVALGLHESVKRAFDPLGILNPGAVLQQSPRC